MIYFSLMKIFFYHLGGITLRGSKTTDHPYGFCRSLFNLRNSLADDQAPPNANRSHISNFTNNESLCLPLNFERTKPRLRPGNK